MPGRSDHAAPAILCSATRAPGTISARMVCLFLSHCHVRFMCVSLSCIRHGTHTAVASRTVSATGHRVLGSRGGPYVGCHRGGPPEVSWTWTPVVRVGPGRKDGVGCGVYAPGRRPFLGR